MADLVDHMNGAAHSAPVRAAVVHAQFETTRPFTDGNGRVGRALVHTISTRRGLTEEAVPPISLVLATLRGRYVDGLGTCRHDAPDGEHRGERGLGRTTESGVQTKAIERGTTAHLAREVLDLITMTERALASTKFDTRVSTPNRPVPARPQR